MKRIYINRKKAKNPFTKITGIKAIQLEQSGCLIVEQKVITRLPVYVSKSTPVKVVAAYVYILKPEVLEAFGYNTYNFNVNIDAFTTGDIKKVTQTCGNKECVNPDHLDIKVNEIVNSWA